MRFVVDYGFRWLALHRVSLGVFESNKGAIATYKKMYVICPLYYVILTSL
jgi:RimJ/RimL family protein N-acetyltransferase